MLTNPKVGDWCFYNTELSQVASIEDGRITGITEGDFSTSGYDLSDGCQPLDMKVKLASEYTKYWYKEITKFRGLNMPDINRKLNDLWKSVCENTDENKSKGLYEKISTFASNIIQAARNTEVDGVSLFRN